MIISLIWFFFLTLAVVANLQNAYEKKSHGPKQFIDNYKQVNDND